MAGCENVRPSVSAADRLQVSLQRLLKDAGEMLMKKTATETSSLRVNVYTYVCLCA